MFAAPRSYDQLGAGDGTENTMAQRMYTGEQVDIWEALEGLLQQAIEVREEK